MKIRKLHVDILTLGLFDPSEQDEEMRRIQAAVVSGMTANASKLQAYLKTWDKYKNIWHTDKDSFMQRYQRLNSPVTSFDADIHRYHTICKKYFFAGKGGNYHFSHDL